MKYHSRTSNSKDVETAAESIISSFCFLRNAVENMDRDTRKTITYQQSTIESFDNYIEKKK